VVATASETCSDSGKSAPPGACADRLLGNGGPAVYCRERSSRGYDQVNLPNLITLARILSVPLVVWAITSGEMLIAFVLFVAAGISDAVDGFLAKRFDMTSELGAYLDPLADKVLIVSIYVALGFSEAVPRWLVILVVSRDLMIIGAVMLSWLVGRPVEVKPLLVSKLNTAAQIFFAGLVLGSLGLQFNPGWALPFTMALVAALTLLSVAAYVREWVRHMGSEPG
jgi:cardiolipin synthase (CMP-forming)